MALTTDKWIGAASADWGASSANWSVGFPNSNSNVVISTAAVLTVTYSGGDNYTVHSLVVGDDVFAMNGGSLTIVGSASFAGGFEQTGGTLTAGAVTLGAAPGALNELLGGGAGGHTAFTVNAALSLGNYTLGGASRLDNKKTTNLTGGIQVGDNTGVGATIDNETGATFTIGGDYGISQGAATARFINAGTLEKTGGSNPSGSFIGVNVSDTGAIVVDTGILEFGGPNDSFAGAIKGAGALVFGAGSKDAINHGATISTLDWTITDNNTVVTLNESLAYSHTFTLQNGAVLDLAGSVVTLGLAGINTFQGNAALEAPGGGTLVTSKGSSTSINSFFVGGGLVWQNFGTVGEVNTLQLGDTTFNPAGFVNEAGGVFKIAADVGITSGSALNSSFVNDAGATLEKTGGAGPGGSVVSVDVTDAGAIVVETGNLFFNGSTNTFAGKISGAGQFAIVGGVSTIASGAAISTATFGIYNNNTFVRLDTNLAYTGTFNLENGAILSLDGVSLTLSGTDTFSNNVAINGKGTLVTTAHSNVSLGSFQLGGALNWQNSGTVTVFNTFEIGDASFDAATFTNEKGGVFDFAAGVDITLGAMPNSSFVNAAGGTVEKTSGGVSHIAVRFTNNGAVVAETGNIEFQNLVGGSGRFTIDTGAALQFDAAVAAGSSVVFASHSGGALLLADSQQFGAVIHGFGGTSTDAIDLFDIQFGNSGPTTLSFRYNAGSTTEGVLTVGDGTHTAHLTFFGTGYKTADFHASNINGGIMLVDPAPHATLLASSG